MDPYGFRWVVAKHDHDVPEKELLAEQEKMFGFPKQTGGIDDKYYQKYLKYKIKYEIKYEKLKNY